MSLFKKYLGVVGWEKIEPTILAALAENVKICFVGTHGSSKTSVCVRLAKALLNVDVKFQRYDGPNVKHEEIFGITNVKALTEGRLEYIDHPQSIRNKEVVLWDEINRPNPMMQSKLNEVLLEGSIHGEKLNLKWQFASANPSAKYDAFYLQPQLAARLFFVKTPEPTNSMFIEMMEASEQYEAFDKLDSVALKKRVSGFGSTFLEVVSDKPSDRMKMKSMQIVSSVMEAMSTGNNGDMFPLSLRESKRMFNMLNRIQIVHKQLKTTFTEESMLSIVLGHVPHNFGMLAHKYDIDSVRSAAVVAYKKAMESDPETIILSAADPVSVMASMIRSKNVDTLSIDHFRTLLRNTDSKNMPRLVNYAVKRSPNPDENVIRTIVEVIVHNMIDRDPDTIISDSIPVSWGSKNAIKRIMSVFEQNNKVV